MKKYENTGNKDTRSGFGAGLTELGQTNENVVALCADLIGSLKMDDFKKNHPERFFQIGIAEANMIGIAAGMTIGGKIPFTGTFANFSTGRVYDQIRQSVAYSEKNVKICASHAGLTLGEDGATHQILEDIGLMKRCPGITVTNPVNSNQTKQVTLPIQDHKGPVNCRLGLREFQILFRKISRLKLVKPSFFQKEPMLPLWLRGIWFGKLCRQPNNWKKKEFLLRLSTFIPSNRWIKKRS